MSYAPRSTPWKKPFRLRDVNKLILMFAPTARDPASVRVRQSSPMSNGLVEFKRVRASWQDMHGGTPRAGMRSRRRNPLTIGDAQTAWATLPLCWKEVFLSRRKELRFAQPLRLPALGQCLQQARVPVLK